MKEHAKMIIGGLLAFPLMIIFYFFYVHIVSLIDPILTIVLGGGFILAILVGIGIFLLNMKDVVVSLFKKDDTRDKKGFKKHF